MRPKQPQNVRPCLVSVGILVATRRRMLRMEQAELATEAGLSRDIIANIELGRQEVFGDQVWNLARALKFAASDLMPQPSTIGTLNLRSLSPDALATSDMEMIGHLDEMLSGKEESYLDPHATKPTKRRGRKPSQASSNREPGS